MVVLQNCLPLSVRRTLEKLPKLLDKTYERILSEIRNQVGITPIAS